MKKVSSIALALLFAASAFAADEFIGQLNPYAYNVQGQAKNGKIAVSYNLNAPADSTIIAIYCDEALVGTQIVADNTMGLHSAVVDLSAFTAPGKYTVGVRVFKESNTDPAQLLKIPEGQTDTAANAYVFWHPKGVAVDNCPTSANFGRILTDEAMSNVPAEGYHSSVDKNGIYAFDPTFAVIPNGNDRAFKGGITFNDYLSNGTSRAYAPYRIRIAADGRTFIGMQDDQLDLIYEASEDLQTFTPLVANATVNGMRAMVGSLDIKTDADGTIHLLSLNCNMRGMGYVNYGWELVEYTIANDGALSSTVLMDSAALINALGFQKDVDPIMSVADLNGKQWKTVITPTNTQFQYAADGGLWYINARSNAFEAALGHVKADGTWDMLMSRVDLSQEGSGDFYGGAGMVEYDGKIYVGMNRYSSTVGQIGVFAVDYTGANTTVTYEKSLRAIEIGRNLNDFAIDYGKNLFVVGNSNERLIAFAMPYSGMTETPVDAEVIKETALNNINGEVKAVKMIENGKVIILKNGVKYDVLGTQIK